MSYQFEHKPYGSIVGSGTYVFRHYGDETQGITVAISSISSTVNTYGYILYNGTQYNTDGDTFTMSPGDSFMVYGKARTSGWTILNFICALNGTTVGSTSAASAYTLVYTFTATTEQSISIVLQDPQMVTPRVDACAITTT